MVPACDGQTGRQKDGAADSYATHMTVYVNPKLLHCGSKKNAPTLADYNYDQVQSILIIFSKLFVNDHKSCPVVKFSTSPHNALFCTNYAAYRTTFMIVNKQLAKNYYNRLNWVVVFGGILLMLTILFGGILC